MKEQVCLLPAAAAGVGDGGRGWEPALRVTLACLTCAHWSGGRSIAPGAPDLFPSHAREVGHWGAMICGVGMKCLGRPQE